MFKFLFILSIYVSANVYIFFRTSFLFHSGVLSTSALALTILLLTISPAILHIYSHREFEIKTRILYYASYMWIAFLVPFCSVAVILDIINLTLQYSNTFSSRDLSSSMLPSDITFLIPLILSLTVNAYGYFEARNLRIERLEIKTSKLPDGVSRVRVAQISDLHLGVIVRDNMLDRVIQLIEEEQPDLIVSTGDLIDGVIRYTNNFGEKLKTMQAPLGKFAVMGNHEIYGGSRHAEKFIQDAGFTLLRGKGTTVGNTINIAGMDYKSSEVRIPDSSSSQKPESEILSELPRGLFTILLKHESDVHKKSLGMFDLQLSGHTHKGQIFPMNIVTMFLYRYHAGYATLPNGSSIYVSRGAGTSGPPIRFLSPPEIAIIDIVAVHT